MGPPHEDDRVPSGRYNHETKSVLYLCDSKTGVVREVIQQGDKHLWVQEFTFKFDELRITDFRPPVEALLNHVFWWTETASKDRGNGFLFSQFIADLVEKDFDGK